MTLTNLFLFLAALLGISLGHPGPQADTTLAHSIIHPDTSTTTINLRSPVEVLFPSINTGEVMTPFSVLPIIAYTAVVLALSYALIRVVRRLRSRFSVSPTPISTKKPSKWTWNGIRRTWKGRTGVRTHSQSGVELLPTSNAKGDHLEYNMDPMAASNVQLNQTRVLSRSPSMEALQDFVPLPPTPLHNSAFLSSPQPVLYQSPPTTSSLSPPPPFHITANALQSAKSLPFKFPLPLPFSVFPPKPSSAYPRTPSPAFSNVNITLATSPLKPHRRSRSLGGVPLRRLSTSKASPSMPLSTGTSPVDQGQGQDDLIPLDRVPSQPPLIDFSEPPRVIFDHEDQPTHTGPVPIPLSRASSSRGSDLGTGYAHQGQGVIVPAPLVDLDLEDTDGFVPENPFLDPVSFVSGSGVTTPHHYADTVHYADADTPHYAADYTNANNPFLGGVPYVGTAHLWAFDADENDDTLVMDRPPELEDRASSKDDDSMYAVQQQVVVVVEHTVEEEEDHTLVVRSPDVVLPPSLTHEDKHVLVISKDIEDVPQEVDANTDVEQHSHVVDTWQWDADADADESKGEDAWTSPASTTAQDDNDDLEDAWPSSMAQDDVDDNHHPGNSLATESAVMSDLIQFEIEHAATGTRLVLDGASLVDSPAHHDGPLAAHLDEPLDVDSVELSEPSPSLNDDDVHVVPAVVEITPEIAHTVIDPSMLTVDRLLWGESLTLESGAHVDFVPNILVHPPSPMVGPGTELGLELDDEPLSKAMDARPLAEVIDVIADPTETAPLSTVEDVDVERVDHTVVVGPTEIEGPIEELVLSHGPGSHSAAVDDNADEEDDNDNDPTPTLLSPRVIKTTEEVVPNPLPVSIPPIPILVEEPQQPLLFPDPDLLPLPGLESLTAKLHDISKGNGANNDNGTRHESVSGSKVHEKGLLSQTPTPPDSPPSASSPLRSPRVAPFFLHGKDKDSKDGKDGKEEKERPAWSLRASDAPALGLSSNTTSPTSPIPVSPRVLPKVIDIASPVSPRTLPKADIIKLDPSPAQVVEEEVVKAPGILLSTSLPGAFDELSSSGSSSGSAPTILITAPDTDADTTTDTTTTTTTTASTAPPKTANSNALTAMAMIAQATTSHVRTRTPRSPLDIALAMQLRPGLGVGADPAWMVRFLMSMFGWLALLVAGQGEF